MDDSVLARTEQQRIDLEANISKLKKALRHWQTLEIEYEGLREEFSLLPPNATVDECLKAAQDFAPALVDEAEIRSLLHHGSRTRSPDEVADILSKRIEYVSRNVASVRSQVSDAEKKRNALLLVGDSEHRQDAELPLTEITEELDEEGNVISVKTESVDSAAPKLAEILKITEAHNVDSNGEVFPDGSYEIFPHASASVEREKLALNGEQSTQDQVPSSRTIAGRISQEPEFITAVAPPSSSMSPQPSLRSQSTHQSIPQDSFVTTHPDDTEEEAILRREMIDYGLNEVGAIVAELDMAEDASDMSYDEAEMGDFLIGSDFEDDGDENELDDDDDESEDEKGMSKHSLISKNYRRQMQELQKKLGLDSMTNMGPSPDLPVVMQQQLDRPTAAEAAGKAAVARAEAIQRAKASELSPVKQAQSGKSKGKTVSFANELDIVPDRTPNNIAIPSESSPIPTSTGRQRTDQDIESLQDSTASQPNTKGKISRFKANRSQADAKELPSAASSSSILKTSPKIMSESLIERPPTTHSSAKSPADHDISDDLDRRQIASEYYKMRNRMIQRQGGFVDDDYDGGEDNHGQGIASLTVLDENTGEEKKISRFKAARLK